MFELWIEVSSQSFKYMVLWNCLMVSSCILWNHIFFVGYHLNFFLLYNKNNFPQTMFERTCIYQNFKHLKRLPIKLFWNANQQICIAHDTLRPTMTLKILFIGKLGACFPTIICNYTGALTRHPTSDQNIFWEVIN